MAKGYSSGGTSASGTASKTAVTVVGSTSVRPRVYGFAGGNSQTPNDYSAKYQLAKFTAAGTAGSSPTPTPVDSGDVAAIATSGAAHSAEPTYGAAFFAGLPLNLRGTYQFWAGQGDEFVSPATAANGIGIQLVTASTAMTSDWNIFWRE